MALWRRTSVTMVAALAGLLPAHASLGQSPATAPAAPRRSTPTPAAVLLSRSSTQPQRDEAARRILASPINDARGIFLAALRDGGHDAQLAVARALADSTRVDPEFVEPLGTLIGGERNLHEAAARALARLGSVPAARDRLLAFARNVNQPPGLRAAVIRACSSVVDKSVAIMLIDLLNDDRQGAVVSGAAADALIDLTGLTENGRDPAAWKRWSDANASKNDDAWKLSVYQSRDARLDLVSQRRTRLVSELDSVLTDQYQAAADKNATALRYLDSAEPEVRAIGARIVRDAFLGGVAAPSDAQKNRLTDLVGDSEPRVRLEVARTLKSINFAGALDAILAQLGEEQDADVKVALLGALAQIGDLRAVSVLTRLLHDPSTTVARYAADAMRALTPALYKADRARAAEMATQLWQVAMQRNQEPGGVELEAACIEALAPLRDASLVLPLMRLLDPQESARTRSSALHALGELGDPNTDDAIRNWLAQEPEASVRVDALDALGKTGSFGADADALYGIFGPRSSEPDKTVRERAWQVFQGLLPTAPKQLLNNWAARLLKEPEQRIAVLDALNRKLLQDRDFENLAISQENTGDTYLKLRQPAKATAYFRKALDYYQSQHVENQVTEHLVGELMSSYLSSRQYPEAAKFAQEMIGANRSQQQTMGSMIVQAADALRDAAAQTPDGTDKADAMKLIDEALKMNPPLAASYQDDLRTIQKELQQKPGSQ